ncbi:MAG: polysaccharide deacetylase family protein [Clostridia bacterium]|nr:polysaccharide deacetylase family protein [Clostridia bacterium]
MIDLKTQLCEEKFMRFPEGAAKALALSFDDGVGADKRLIPLLKKYGLRCSFNLNSECFGEEYMGWHGRMGEEEAIKTYSECGQEIAIHGAKHLFLTKVPLHEAAGEVLRCREYLEKTFGGIIRGMAYAYGAYDDGVVGMLKSLGVVYARTTASTYGFDVPSDFLRLDPTVHFTEDETGALAEKFVKEDPRAMGKDRDARLFYVWGHAYELDDFGLWDKAEKFVKELSGAEGIWRATTIDIVSYVTAYGRLEFSLDGERVFNPSARPVWIEIRGETYKISPGCEINFKKS